MTTATATKSETCFVVAQALHLTLARPQPTASPQLTHVILTHILCPIVLALLLPLPDLIAVELQFAPTEQSISVKSL